MNLEVQDHTIEHSAASEASTENQVFSQDLLDLVGVTPKAFVHYHTAVEQQLARIEDANSRVINRQLRKAVDGLCSIVKDIIVESIGDNNLIREDLSVPGYLERIADCLYLYVNLAASLNFHENVQTRIEEIEDMIGKAGPFFTDILDRMESSKANPDMVRTRVLSRVFSALRRNRSNPGRK